MRVGNNGLIEFQDKDLTGCSVKLRFVAMVAQPDGSGCRLAPGAEYGLYVLPQDMTKAVIVEKGTRAVLGIAPAWSSVDPLNEEQVGIMVEAQARMIASQAAPLRERHAERSEEMEARREQTNLLLEGLTVPRKPGKRQQGNNKETGRALVALAKASSSTNSKKESGDEW